MVTAGSENGVHREKVLASIQTSFDDMHGISRQNTAIDWSVERVQSTSGTDTQPKEEGDLFYGPELAGTDSTPADTIGTATPAEAAAMATQGNTTANAPAKPINDGSKDLPPSDTQPRNGTSAAKMEQQDVGASAV
jgi:hypothetical protein